jgi:glycerol-3-phosphate acyltransferase PlsX
MDQTIRIAIDAMGGDHGPTVVIPACALALQRRPGLTFLFFGIASAVEPVLDAYPQLKARSTLTHCDVSVAMDAKPSQALRQGRRNSSMWRAIDAVRQGDADVAISGGNTGALMAMAKICLRTLANVERPAMAAVWPTLKREAVVLDVGATIGADAQQLADYAVMGAAMARVIFQVDRPTVGLLNVGVEEVKGVEEVRAAGRLLREANLPHLDYQGFVEGDDIGQGKVDVVVTEGFSGNIAIKVAEGTSRQLTTFLRGAMGATLASRIGYLLAKGAFRRLRDKMDPRKHNGAVFLGLNGLVVKSHGGTDIEGFATAVDFGFDAVRHGLIAKIEQGLSHFHHGEAIGAAVAVPKPEDEGAE